MKKKYEPLQLVEKYERLFEVDNRKEIARIFKYPAIVIDALHKLSQNDSLTIARMLFNTIQTMAKSNTEKILIKKIERKKLFKDVSENKSWDMFVNRVFSSQNIKKQLPTIRDWLRGRKRNPEIGDELINLEIMPLGDAYIVAKEWLNKKSIETEGSAHTGKTIIKYRDGFYWVDLETNDDELEKALASSYSGKSEFGNSGNLYSLRDSKGKIILTADVNKTNGDVRKIVQKGSLKPEVKYHKYILDFLMNKKIKIKKESFKQANWENDSFQMSDLSDKDYIKLASHFPNWNLDRFQREGGDSADDNTFRGDVDIESYLNEETSVSSTYSEEVARWMEEEGYSVSDIDDTYSDEIEFDNGRRYRFYTTDEADDYIWEYYNDNTYMMYESDDWEYYVNEDALGDYLIDYERDEWKERAENSPEDYIDEAPEGEDGEYTEEQIEKAIESSISVGEELVWENVIYYATNYLGWSSSDFYNFVNEEGWVRSMVENSDWGELPSYDGDYDQVGDVVIIRIE